MKAALARIPSDCTVQGVWRDEDYREPVEHLKSTLILCSTPTSRFVWTVYDGGTPAPHAVELDATGHAIGTTADTYTVDETGILTISDDEGVFKTLTPP